MQRNYKLRVHTGTQSEYKHSKLSNHLIFAIHCACVRALCARPWCSKPHLPLCALLYDCVQVFSSSVPSTLVSFQDAQ